MENKLRISNIIFNKKNINRLNQILLSGYRLKSSNTEYADEYTAIVMDKGKRKHNEDAALSITHPENKEFRLVAVADGMGGHFVGDRFSYKTLKYLSDWFNSLPEYYYYRTDLLYPALRMKIMEISEEFSLDLNDGGNTLVLGIICEYEVLCVNLGDSRLYGYDTRSGNLQLVTEDESVVWTSDDPLELYKQRFHKNSSRITNCLYSGGNVNIDQMYTFDRGAFDRLVLCTDGVSDMMSFDEMNDLLDESETNLDMAKSLVRKATTEDSFSEINYGPDYAYRLPAGKDNATCLVTTITNHKVKEKVKIF